MKLITIKMMTKDSDANNLKVHFFYVTLILTLIIVGLVTHKWTGIAEFREYLNVGATVTSLVLGILAIIYSFVSSGQQSSVLGAVQSAANTTGNSVSKLDTFMAAAERLQSDASQRTNDLHTLTRSLADSIDGIGQETRSLIALQSELAGKVNILPAQLGELKGIIEQNGRANPSTNPIAQPQEKLWTASTMRKSLMISSIFGLTVIEALINGNALGKEVSTKKLSDSLGGGDDYLWGYVIGYASTLQITFETSASFNQQFRVITVDPELAGAVSAEWERRITIATSSEEKANLAKSRASAFDSLVDANISSSEKAP